MRQVSKIRLIIFTILLFSIATFAIIRYLIIDKSRREGVLAIVSSPIASVFINNEAINRLTPFEKKFKPGEYLIKLIPQGDATASATWEDKVNIYANSKTYINRELGSSRVTSSGEILTSTFMKEKPEKSNLGEILIETDPVGAIIKLDNDEKGVAPLLLSGVLKGTHELNILLPGFFPRTKKINVDAGYRVNARFKLAVDQSQKPVSQASKSASIDETTKEIEVIDTEVGFLRVRQEPSVNSDEIGRVNPGDKFTIIEEASGWIKIEYEPSKEGWVSKTYTKEIK
ncbi:MAG: SH3 domain-containing protein [bacterium]